jgi:hypothetical protein
MLQVYRHLPGSGIIDAHFSLQNPIKLPISVFSQGSFDVKPFINPAFLYHSCVVCTQYFFLKSTLRQRLSHRHEVSIHYELLSSTNFGGIFGETKIPCGKQGKNSKNQNSLL